jgi:hypothetical protein
LPGGIYITGYTSIEHNRIHKNGSLVFSQPHTLFDHFIESAYKFTGMEYPKFYKMDRLCKLGMVAAEVLLGKENYSHKYGPYGMGLVLMNANSSIEADTKYFNSVKNIPSPALFVYTLPNILIGEICIKNNFKGENAFFIFEQFNPQFLQQYVDGLFNNSILQACICGWVDVCGESYKAVLMLAEKELGNNSPSFTQENIFKIYHHSTNG